MKGEMDKMTKLKAIRKIEVKKDCKDLKGWGLRKGTILHVIKECPPHPIEKYKILLVRVDNGMESLDLMPETAVRDIEVE